MLTSLARVSPGARSLRSAFGDCCAWGPGTDGSCSPPGCGRSGAEGVDCGPSGGCTASAAEAAPLACC